MKAIFRREVRDLAPVLVIMASLAAIQAAGIGESGFAFLTLYLAIVHGCVVGLAQGRLDLKRQDEPFERHRPVAGLRIHLARSLAGVFSIMILAAIVFGSRRFLWPVFHAPATWSGDPQDLRMLRSLTLHPHATLHLLGCLAAWAIIRLSIVPRALPLTLFPLRLILPAAAFSLSLRTASLSSHLLALGLMATLGTLAVLILLATSEVTRAARAARAAVLLAILVLAFGEGLIWVRRATTTALSVAYPMVGMTPDGEGAYWIDSPEYRTAVIRLDRDRRRGLTEDRPDNLRPVRLRSRSNPWNASSEHLGMLDPAADAGRSESPENRIPLSWSQQVVSNLNAQQSLRDSSLFWREREGRFECLDLKPRAQHPPDIRASVGPDGMTLGAEPVEAPAFEPATEVLPLRPNTAMACLVSRQQGVVTRLEVDLESGRIGGPIPVKVLRDLLHIEDPEAPIRSFRTRGRALVLSDREILVLRPGRKASRAPWRAETERVLGCGARPTRHVGPIVLATEPQPASMLKGRIRLRIFDAAGACTIEDMPLTPTSAFERILAGLGGCGSLLRPLPLNVAAFFDDPPATWKARNHWWWRDPDYAGHGRRGWLVASILLAFACGIIAHRRARVRCATRREGLMWTGLTFGLGPIGLILMRIVIGNHAVRFVGNGVRAVNLETCPASDAPWPPPTANGTEIFA